MGDDVEPAEGAGDPAQRVALADTVGAALQVVLDRLAPAVRPSTAASVTRIAFRAEPAVLAGTQLRRGDEAGDRGAPD